MRQLSDKQIMLTIAVSGILLAGGALGGVYWAKTCVEEEQVMIADLDKKIGEAERKKSRIPQDESEVIILRENVAEYVKILPESKDLTEFTRTINSFTQNSDVVLTSLTPANAGGGKKSAFTQFQYNLSFTGTLWQFMKFVNLFESYKRFVKITSFKLTAGRADKGQSTADAVHQFSMSVVTYTYNQAAGGKKPVSIVQYEQKRDRLREDIYRARQNIEVDRYTFGGPRARRDIFVDPRVDQAVASETVGSASIQEQNKVIERLATLVKAADAKYRQAEVTNVLLLKFEMIRDVKASLTKVAKEISDVNERGVITYRPYMLKFQKDVQDPFEKLRREVFRQDAGGQPEGIPMEELTSIRRFMEDALSDGRLEDAVDKFELVREKLAFSPDDPRSPVAERLTDLYQKSKIAQEFSRLDLRVTGAILLDRGLSTAIINGKTYTEGDAITDHLFLKEIGVDYIEFLYRGVVLRKKR